MECLREREVKYLFVFLISCLFWHTVTDVLLCRLERQAAGEMLSRQAGIVASALLERGMSPLDAGKVLRSDRITPEGRGLVEQIGLNRLGAAGEESVFMEEAYGGSRMSVWFLWTGGILSAVMLPGGVFFYLSRRERLCQEAVCVMERFLEGDYSGTLAGMKEGTLYRFFALTDSLARDMEAGREMQEQSREFLKRIISDISHQLKTPLAALSVYNEIILGNPGSEEAVREFSHKTAVALNRMEQLIGKLLKLARLDAGGICFERKRHPAAEVADRAVEELRTRALLEEKQIWIQQDEKTLLCDLDWSVEAVQNLVKNALDHMDRGGTVRIEWESTPLMFRISVTDNGRGIAPEDLHHIFKRFYRGRRIPGSEEGTGLGLPLVRGIMEGQGGSVSVRSTPGEETVFTLSFLTEL